MRAIRAAARADAPMHFWLYRVLQLGVLLLAAGTILGGVWANYSWGRFWGWDPKETWALIALLCYILTLHGRLAGWWTRIWSGRRERGLFSRGLDGVVRRELCSWQRTAQLWVRHRRRDLRRDFCRCSICFFVAFAIWRYRSSKLAVAAADEIEGERVAV